TTATRAAPDVLTHEWPRLRRNRSRASGVHRALAEPLTEDLLDEGLKPSLGGDFPEAQQNRRSLRCVLVIREAEGNQTHGVVVRHDSDQLFEQVTVNLSDRPLVPGGCIHDFAN